MSVVLAAVLTYLEVAWLRRSFQIPGVAALAPIALVNIAVVFVFAASVLFIRYYFPWPFGNMFN